MKQITTLIMVCLLLPMLGLSQTPSKVSQMDASLIQKLQLDPQVLESLSKDQRGLLRLYSNALEDTPTSSAHSIRSRSFATQEVMDSSIFQIFLDDSTGFQNLRKNETRFDTRGNLLDNANYFWEAPISQWIGSFRFSTSYDNNDLITQEFRYEWDFGINDWAQAFRFDYVYQGPVGLPSSINGFAWDTTLLAWNPSERTDQLYNANDQFIGQMTYAYNDSLDEFILEFKTELTYTENGQIQSFTAFTAPDTGTTFLPVFKAEEAYDERNNNISTSIFFQNDFTLTLELWSKSVRDFDLENRIIAVVDSSVNFFTGVFDFSSRDTIEYNEIGKRSQVTTESQNLFTLQLEGSRSRFDYDANGNLSTQFQDIFETGPDSFLVVSQTEYKYDTSIPISDIFIGFLGIPEPPVNKLLSVETASVVDTVITPIDKEEFFYSPFSATSIDLSSENLIQIYPNPSSGRVFIDLPKDISKLSFELFDMQGRKIDQRVLQGNEGVRLNVPAAGMYIYRLGFQGKLQQGKLVLVK